jgi:hypothetical protein
MFVSTSLHALLVPRLFTVRLDGQSPQPVLQPFLRNMRYVVSWNWHPDSKRVSLYVRTSSLSYDGSRLAYVADRAGTAKMEFWMTDLTGGNHRQLTDDDHARFTP